MRVGKRAGGCGDAPAGTRGQSHGRTGGQGCIHQKTPCLMSPAHQRQHHRQPAGSHQQCTGEETPQTNISEKADSLM